MSQSKTKNGPINEYMYGLKQYKGTTHVLEFGQKDLPPNIQMENLHGKIGG